MSRVQRQFCGWLLIYLLLLVAEDVKKSHPFPNGVGEILPHLFELATLTLAGLVLIWVAEEIVEHHIAPAIRDGLTALAIQVAKNFEETVEHDVAPAIRDGLTTLASQVAVNLKTQLEVPPAVITEIRAAFDSLFERDITTPVVRALVDEGRIAEAIKKAKSGDEEMAVLLKSDKPEDWHKGFQLVERMHEPRLVYYVTLAYRFWDHRDLDNARRVAETGLSRAEHSDQKEYVAKLKNTLAFVYAEQGAEDREAVAKQYASEALADSPDSPLRLDTMSYVVIRFAHTEFEIEEGVRLAESARVRGLPFEDFARSIAIANERLHKIRESREA